jgi:acetyl-CoA carboxylase biotin carboxyl carrier protein
VRPSRKENEMTIDQGEEVRALMHRFVREVVDTCGPVSRIRVCSGDLSLEVEWPSAAAPAVGVAVPPVPGPVALPAGPDAESASSTETGGIEIRSPLVGTFYHAPSPGTAPFVTVGDVLGPNDQVGIIEAMKLMNPVTAESAGRVVAILVEDATPVEYDQPLLVLAPVA